MTDKELGARIAVALKLNGLKQKDLAKELGVACNTVSYWCTGGRVPNVHQLYEIARRLNVSADYLLGLFTNNNERLLLDLRARLTAWETWAAGAPTQKKEDTK